MRTTLFPEGKTEGVGDVVSLFSFLVSLHISSFPFQELPTNLLPEWDDRTQNR